VVIFSGIAIGFLGWGVWAHHMFATGLGPVTITAFGLATMLIAIPTGVKIFNWLGTVYGGAVKLTSAMLFSLGFVAMFTLGGLSGVLHSVVPADTQQTDTYFVVAHFHYVLFGGLMFGVFSGFYYWWPKVFGHLLNETLGKVNFWLLLFGFNLTFFPMHILGLTGMPRRTYRYPSGYGWTGLNQIVSIGGFIVALATLIFVVNIIFSAIKRVPAGNDPWDGRSLEPSRPVTTGGTTSTPRTPTAAWCPCPRVVPTTSRPRPPSPGPTSTRPQPTAMGSICRRRRSIP
jgi:cytochrome c oxidase subunit 1